MDHDDLAHWSKRAADWARDYHATLRDRPVRPNIAPGEFRALIDAPLPEDPEPIETIFDDFTRLVPDAMTHWQHPRFFAYFPANAAPASMLAEQLANAMAAQAMLWQTAPAANEMEELVIDWMREALGLPEGFTGTIHDSATTATFSAVATMREQALNYEGVTQGLHGGPRLRLYASAQTHSSVTKAARLTGIGAENLVQVPGRRGDPHFSMDPTALDRLIREDKAAGYTPIGVVLATGGTAIGACDDLDAAIAVARDHHLPTHVDAAWAGSAMICPEFRDLWAGVEQADSVVFNPHKWLGAQFDLSIQFLRDPTPQVRTMGLRPAYLQTLGDDEVTNFNEWTLPLGRRFRALKLWFLLRAEGLSGLRARIRNHVAWAHDARDAIAALPGFEIVTEPILSLFTFRFRDDATTERLLDAVNRDGRIYLTQTSHDSAFVIRMQVGQFDVTREDVMMVPDVLREISESL
ncbi:pyridoxal phosphate-dependent decarboxylase family protein [Maritimibacter dapengensis]|uniref:Aspartate aminotransferase family protein n=1 Tax=Maritimibacter dapengensis TaxID=2836868 RepID=A0ABS6T2Y6_9RHOB|nr:pyridoxal-dependent decarboxylase [Maritimibacter dapengensis]MBV7379565.1 aspartate aminotransferase family protein [Maritimibacter dapengensis]